ncbi:MAG: arylsulfatase [Bacteroidota bacterium]
MACQPVTTNQTLEEASTDLPNIIFIMADDLGYGDLGSFGQRVIQTPNLDQMAKEGMRLTQCYAGSPVCAPSRSCLMTGLHTGHTTVRGNFGKTGVLGLAGNPGRVPLKAEDLTIAEALKEGGYVTGMFGKWGLGEPNTTGHPNDQGFDTFFGFLNQRRAHNYYPEYLWHNKEKVELAGNLGDKEEEYAHDKFSEKALDFVREHRDRHFFLYLPYTVPHARYQIPDTSPYTAEPWEEKEKIHAAMISRMDRDIGDLFDLLKELQIDDKSIVFFCSDNGAAERWEGRFDSSGALRGRKRDMYEGGIRSPMIVRYPAEIEGGSSSDFPCYFPDIMPTLLDIASLPIPDGLDGVSILPTLLGEKQTTATRHLYWEFHERGFQQAVRYGNWKAVRLKVGGALELYDLSTDEGEMHNVASQHPALIQEIESYLASARTLSVDWPGPSPE